MALHNRSFGTLVVPSKNGSFVVTITAALSARPAMIWNNSSAGASGIATYAISSITINSYENTFRRSEQAAPGSLFDPGGPAARPRIGGFCLPLTGHSGSHPGSRGV